MDFTYFAAGIFGVIVGFVAAVIFIALKLGSKRWLLATSFGISLVLAGILLFDWTRISSLSMGFLAVDLGFTAIYTLVGCFLGICPPLAVRWLWRATHRPKG